MFFTGEAELRDDWIFKCCRISNEFQPDYAKCRFNTLEVRAGGAAFRCTLTWMHLFLPFPTFYLNHLHGGQQRYETELFTENLRRDNKQRFNRFSFFWICFTQFGRVTWTICTIERPTEPFHAHHTDPENVNTFNSGCVSSLYICLYSAEQLDILRGT